MTFNVAVVPISLLLAIAFDKTCKSFKKKSLVGYYRFILLRIIKHENILSLC